MYDKSAADMLMEARLSLMVHHKFWGYLATNLVFVEREDGGGGRTTAVDAKGNFYYNKEWVESMSLEDLKFEIGHELMHIVQKCIDRFPEGGNRQAWNLAADYLADTYLHAAGNGIPQSSISQKMVPKEIQQKVKDEVIEEIYYDLLKNSKEQNIKLNVRGCENGTNGSGNEGFGKDGEEKEVNGNKLAPFNEAAKIKWAQAMMSAEQICVDTNQAGSVPGYVRDFLLKLRKPTVSWKDKLRTTATTKFKGRYTFHQPSRRGHTLGVRLQRKKPTPEGAILMFDTSGSMRDTELIQAASEAVGILNACGAAYAHVFFHDVSCYYHAEYTKNEMTNLKVTRGGTSHIDVFKVAMEEKNNIGMVVAFTDLETSFPEEEPPFPVIWCHSPRSESHNVPWGTKVEMKL